eukprot:COSAG01_NODE_1058_length_11898_cov_53.877871_4_plen_76_part_00
MMASGGGGGGAEAAGAGGGDHAVPFVIEIVSGANLPVLDTLAGSLDPYVCGRWPAPSTCVCLSIPICSHLSHLSG